MDDRPPLEDRLASWFAAETRRAEHDLRDGLRPRRAGVPGRRRAAVLAVVAAVAVALGTAGLRLVAPSADVGASPSASAAAAASSAPPSTPRPTASPGVVLGDDGLPTRIDGASVGRLDGLRAELDRADTTIVAGWVDQPLYACAQPEWPLLPTCTGRRLSAAEPEGRAGGLSVDLVIGDVPVPFGPVAARVHTRDPGAESCPPGVRARCSAAIVVDEVLWHDDTGPVITGLAPDGIPTEIDGQPVIRPSVLVTIDGAGPWLVGGWHNGDGALRDAPLGDAMEPTGTTNQAGGPLVVRVQAGDPLRIEDVVWSRDADGAPAPLDEVAVARAIGGERDAISLTPAPPGKEDCDPGWPTLLWEANPGGTVGRVAIYPTTDAADAVHGGLFDAGWRGMGCSVIFDSLLFSWRWIRVENAIIQFNLTSPDGTPAELEVVERVSGALEAAATAP